MPRIDDFGNIIGTFGISRDITKIKTMDAALASERNLLRSVIDNVPDRILLKDHQGRYMLSNVAHSRFLGVDDPKETLEKSWSFFAPCCGRTAYGG